MQEDFKDIEENFATDFTKKPENESKNSVKSIIAKTKEMGININDRYDPLKESNSRPEPVSTTQTEVDKVGEVSNADLQAIQAEYEKKLKAIQKENDRLRASSSGLTKNEEKILSAIKSEILIQKADKPVIGRAKFKKEYKVNERYLGDAIEGLIQKKVVKREYVNYSAKIKTSQWEIL